MVASLSQGLGAVECRTAHLIQGGDRVIQRRFALMLWQHACQPAAILAPFAARAVASAAAIWWLGRRIVRVEQASSPISTTIVLGLCLPNVLSLIGASDPLPKVLAAVPLAYFVSPIQLIPSFIRC